MNDDEHIQLIVKGIDDGATRTISAVNSGLSTMEGQAGKVSGAVGRIKSSLSGLAGWIKAGVGIGIGEDLFNAVERGLEAIPRAFFGAVDAGQAWLMTVKDIERATGMSATQSSEWAAVMERVGVPVGDVDRILSQLGHNLLENEDLFKRAGIATRDASGQFLSTFQILQNIRHVMSENGQSIQNSGLAQELLARGGYKWLEVLQLTDAQWKTIAADAARSGEVVGEQQTRQAEELTRLQDRVQGAIQGLQTAIFTGVVPVLSAFVDQFATWIEDHMQQIADFVANVASFIAGVLGGLLGVDFAAQSSAAAVEDLGNKATNTGMGFADWAKNAAKAKTGDDALTTGLKDQIKAIDAQIKAIQHRSDALHAAEERARLDQALSSAQAQLADLKGNSPFTQGLSNAEAVLARQKHAQDIVDAEKAVSDAKSGINQFEADQSVKATIDRLQAKKAALNEEVAAHKKAVDQKAAYDQYLVGVNQAQDTTIAKAAASMFTGITAQAKSWRDNGVKFAGDVKNAIGGVMEALLGTETTPSDRGETTHRTGGLISALGLLGEAVSATANFIAEMARFAASVLPQAPSTNGMNDFLWGPGGSPEQAARDFAAQFMHLFSFGILAGPTHHAGGGLAGVNGPELSWLGEEGAERVIPNDELDEWHHGPTAAAGAGGHVTTNHFHLHFDMLTAPSREQLRTVAGQLFAEIDQRFQIKGDNAPVGVRAYRGATI